MAQEGDSRTAESEPDQVEEERPDRSEDQRPAERSDGDNSQLLELVSYLRDCRTELREEWARRISEADLLQVMSDDEIFSEATEVYDNYMDALETGSIETLQTYARELSERIIPRGVETDEVLGIVLLLRDVLARSLFAKYQEDLDHLNRVLDAYEPAANRIAVTVGVSFVEERERVIQDQQESIRELSTPVLLLRERLLILPIIGVLDSSRARQLTEQLLGAIRDNRATVVVIDITGVATIDRTVANHLVQTVEAHGGTHHPHRPVLGDRADGRRSRGRPQHDADGRRPAGWHRGSRAAGRLRGRRGGRLRRRRRQLGPAQCRSPSCAKRTTSSPPSSRTCPTRR
jgi:rsbT co-antagonist protein RsbR